jgi:hypothetical protein
MGWDLNSGQTIGEPRNEPVCYWSDRVKRRARSNMKEVEAELTEAAMADVTGRARTWSSRANRDEVQGVEGAP